MISNLSDPKFWFFILYFLILSIVFYDTRLPQDAYYYVQWSQHLQLSYFDGPPLIAYALRLYTLIFGTQEFALLMFAFLCTALTCWMLWRTAALFFNTSIAQYAVWFWLLSPGILYFFTLQITYNTVMICLWGISFFTFGNLILKKKIRYYYYCGISFGFLLLAQYTGILLLLSFLFICIYYENYRFIFKNPHFYATIGIALCIFSPVLIWNAQHNWVSFLFQFQHGFQAGQTVAHLAQIKVYLSRNLVCYNLSLLALIWAIWKHKKTILRTPELGLFLLPTLCVFVFFGLSAYFAPTQNNWSAPFFFSGSILLAYYVQPQLSKLHKSILSTKNQAILLSIILIGSGGLLFEENFTETKWLKTLINTRRGEGVPAAMQKLTRDIPTPYYTTKPIFVDRYQLGAHLAYFLHPKQPIYASNPAAHQYYFWWLEEQNRHPRQTLNNGFYYMSQQTLNTSNAFLKTCTLKKKISTSQKQLWNKETSVSLFIYDCQNPNNFILPT